MWTKKILMADADANTSGGDAPKPADKAPPAITSEQFAAAQKRAEKAEAELAARKAAEEKARQNEEIEKGRSKDVIAAKEAELAAAKEKAEKFEAKMRERAEAAYAKLPKEKQAKVDKYKDTIGLEQWSEMVDDELAEVGATPEPTPFVGAGASGGQKGDASKKYKPTTKAVEILDKMLKTPDTLESLTVTKGPDGTHIFSDPIQTMFQKMKRGRVEKLSSENADKRRSR